MNIFHFIWDLAKECFWSFYGGMKSALMFTIPVDVAMMYILPGAFKMFRLIRGKK
jgi:hypothetical protein